MSSDRRKHGKGSKPGRLGTPTQRFWNQVSPEPMSGCWLWAGTVSGSGYGQLQVGDHKVVAHKFAYELFRGPVPEGLTLDHLCRVRSCVNPAHLEAVTMHLNIMRGTSPSARNAAKTHCKRGHEFTAGNTLYRKGGRDCRICQVARHKKTYLLNREVSA